MKDLIKYLLWLTLGRAKRYTTFTVRSGPAKGTRLNLDLRKEGSYWLGTYDNWILGHLKLDQIIQPGWTVWDCGAYVGYYTAIFRRLVGETGQVITFEAAKDTYDRIRALPQLNDWANVQIFNWAIGPDHTEIEFVTNLNGSNGPFGLSKTYAAGKDSLAIQRVRSLGVDELVQEEHIPLPDLIKFDIESAEEYALQNGDYLFSTKRPVIFLELHGQKAFDTAGAFLEQYRYQAKDISQYHDSSRPTARTLADLKTWGYIPHMLICHPRQ